MKTLIPAGTKNRSGHGRSRQTLTYGWIPRLSRTKACREFSENFQSTLGRRAPARRAVDKMSRRSARGFASGFRCGESLLKMLEELGVAHRMFAKNHGDS